MNATRHNKPPLPHIWKNLKDGEVPPIPELKRDRMECLRYVFSDEKSLEQANSLLEQMTTTRSGKLGVLESGLRGMTGGEFALLREQLNALYLEPVIVRGNLRPTPDENGDPYNLEFAIHKGKAWAMAMKDIQELLEAQQKRKAVFAQRPRSFTLIFTTADDGKASLIYPNGGKQVGLTENQATLIRVLKENGGAIIGKTLLQEIKEQGAFYFDVTALAHSVVAINKKVSKELGIDDFISNNTRGYVIDRTIRLK